MAQTPGDDFYYERLAKVTALPEAERGEDARRWLRLHAAIDAALSVLPELPPGSDLTEPLGGPRALAGLLCFLATACGEAGEGHIGHPGIMKHKLAPQLPPLMRVRRLPHSGELEMSTAPLLAGIRSSGSLPGGEADLGLVARLMLLARLAQWPGIGDYQAGLDALMAARRNLFTAASTRQLEQQLAQLAQQCTGAGSNDTDASRAGTGGCHPLPPLPSVQQLRAAWHVLAFELAYSTHLQAPPAAASATMHESARALLAMHPDSPGCCYLVGRAAVFASAHQSPSQLAPLLDPLPHFLRGRELASQQGSDMWLGR